MNPRRNDKRDEFASLLLKWRAKHGWNREEAADKLGVPRRTLQEWESRKLGDDEIRNNRKKKGYNVCCICVDNALVLRSVNVAEIERKVDRVRRALVAYGLVTPGMVAVKDLTDLLGDLRHYCDFIGKDFAAFDKNAHQQYLDEKGPIKFG